MFFIIFISVFLLVSCVLASPAAAKQKSWLKFFVALLQSFFGVTLPLFVYFLSTFMTPDWKGACHYGWVDCFITGKLATTLPLWLISGFWSRSLFESLPNKAPDCFIVTAASRGHEKCVGPLIEITRNGRKMQANQQLLTFWTFESRWQNNSPRSYRLFRRGYNRIGPVIARQIRSPWQADLVFLVIKPAELVAKLAIKHV